MNQIKRLLISIFPILLFTSCMSTNSIQSQMQGVQSELFYFLTTPVYPGNTDKTIYLSPIVDTVSIPYTTVKRKGRTIIPLILYNSEKDKYEVSLGESSLIQPYNEFLMDALSAQCNRSSCFNLRLLDDIILPDSALILEIKVNKNITTAKMIYKDVGYLIPLSDTSFSFGYTNWEVNQPVSWLIISARLMQQGNCLWEKTYSTTSDLPYHHRGIEKPIMAYEICIDDMTECLSNTTKEIVDNISQNLHEIMLTK